MKNKKDQNFFSASNTLENEKKKRKGNSLNQNKPAALLAKSLLQACNSHFWCLWMHPTDLMLTVISFRPSEIHLAAIYLTPRRLLQPTLHNPSHFLRRWRRWRRHRSRSQGILGGVPTTILKVDLFPELEPMEGVAGARGGPGDPNRAGTHLHCWNPLQQSLHGVRHPRGTKRVDGIL